MFLAQNCVKDIHFAANCVWSIKNFDLKANELLFIFGSIKDVSMTEKQGTGEEQKERERDAACYSSTNCAAFAKF